MATVAMDTEQVHHTVAVAMDPATCQFQYMDMEVLVLVSEDRDSVSFYVHWRGFQYAVTHVRNKNSNTQGRSSNVVKMNLIP